MRNLEEFFYYPEALNWMWNYCVPLGKFEHNGKKYDLGIHYDRESNELSGAIVGSNKPGDYWSPHYEGLKNPSKKSSMAMVYGETLKRYQALITESIKFVDKTFILPDQELEMKLLITKLDALGIGHKRVGDGMFVKAYYYANLNRNVVKVEYIDDNCIVYLIRDELGCSQVEVLEFI